MIRSIRRSVLQSAIEKLETRKLLSASVLRVVAYNIEDDINGATTPRAGLYQVLEGIGEEKVAGNVRPVDILGLEETTSNADGNGPNALVYNTSTLTLLASVGVVTPEGATNGVYRQPVRYEFQPVGDTGTTGIFYVYVMHTKSGTGTTNAKYRGEEAAIVRSNEATLPSTASVIYMGDLNSNPPEAMFTNFEATGQGEAFDPFNFPSSPTEVQESDSSTSLAYRDDYQLQTSNVFNDTGAINYVTSSFHNFGNNGSVKDPASSSNTALNSDLVTDGGTFIPASTIYTDLGTASDHLPVVADYTITTSTATPTIGSFTLSPTSVTSGASTTLTASNVTETGGTISNVKFYRESNGTSGLQIGSDTLIGTGNQSGTTWTISTSTSGFTAGTYTYYAVATDSTGNSSAASSTTLTVTAGTPTIGSFTLSPTSVITGTATTLTAASVTEAGGTISNVKFYLESNGTSGLQIGSDTLVGTGTQSGTTWTISAPTTGFAPGTYTYYAVATDSTGVSSAASSTTLIVTAAAVPTIGSFTLSPTSVTSGTPTTLTAASVTETGGTISNVKFYLESNGTSGLQIGSDTLIGTGTQAGTTWTISAATTGFAAGTYTYYAVATDSAGNSSAVSSATLTVTVTQTSGTLLAWDVSGQTNYGTQGLAATTVGADNTNSTGLTRGSGVATTGTAAANAWGGAGWAATSAAGITGNEFASFGLTVSAGDSESLTSINMNYRRSSTGPSSGYWQYQIGATGTWTLIGDEANEFSSTSSSGAAITTLSLSSITALQNLSAGAVVNIRVVPYGSTSSAGTWYVYNETGNDLVLNGTAGSAPQVIKAAATPSTDSTTQDVSAWTTFTADDVMTQKLGDYANTFGG